MLNLSMLVQINSQLLIPAFKCKARKHEKNYTTQEVIPQQRTAKLSRYFNWGGSLCGIEFVSVTESFFYLILFI